MAAKHIGLGLGNIEFSRRYSDNSFCRTGIHCNSTSNQKKNRFFRH